MHAKILSLAICSEISRKQLQQYLHPEFNDLLKNSKQMMATKTCPHSKLNNLL
jgi:hypothetical protein